MRVRYQQIKKYAVDAKLLSGTVTDRTKASLDNFFSVFFWNLFICLDPLNTISKLHV